jgi:hypothetical protein
MPKVSMPTCEWCGEDDPHACSWCGRMTCYECVETTSMGCVHRKRIREVTNPDWIIVEEAADVDPRLVEYMLKRYREGRLNR